jgi:hypothetical protein
VPQLYSQGDGDAILDKLTPAEAVVYVAATGVGPRGDAVAYYRWAETLALAVRAEYRAIMNMSDRSASGP